MGITFSWVDWTNKKVPRVKGDLVAYCTSINCCGMAANNKKLGVIKRVRKALIDCPECKSALLWVRGNTHRLAEKT